MRSEGGPLGLLLLVASGFVALCCAVVVLAGKPAPDEPDAIDEVAPVAPVHEAKVDVEPAAPVEPVQPAPPPAAPEPPAQPQDPYVEPVGHLHVYSTPVARIVVDGTDTGLRTPIRGDKLPLAPGKHKVTFVLGDDKYTFTVRIKAGETQTITKTLTPSAEPPAAGSP